MSMLLFDVGNSRLKWALAREALFVRSGAIAHGGDPASALAAVAAAVPAAHPLAAWAANVTGEAHAQALSEAVHARFALPLHFAQVAEGIEGLRLAYAEPRRLGVDRWLAMLALRHRRHGAFAVASCGTALTFDAVDALGKHLGGVIAPGLVTAQQAVLGATRFAAAGPDLEYEDGLGADTEACVRQGALHACAGLIERLSVRYAPVGALRVLTGGDAALLAPHLARNWEVRSELVLEGLLAYAQTARVP